MFTQSRYDVHSKQTPLVLRIVWVSSNYRRSFNISPDDCLLLVSTFTRFPYLRFAIEKLLQPCLLCNFRLKNEQQFPSHFSSLEKNWTLLFFRETITVSVVTCKGRLDLPQTVSLLEITKDCNVEDVWYFDSEVLCKGKQQCLHQLRHEKGPLSSPSFALLLNKEGNLIKQ